MESEKGFWCLLGFHKWGPKYSWFAEREGPFRPHMTRRCCQKCNHIKYKRKLVFVGPP